MPDDYDKLVARAKDFLTSSSEWCDTCDGIAKFGQLAERSDSAVSVLLELASHDSGMVRFLSTAALAGVGAEPKRVVPLLVAVLDAWREMGYPQDRNDEAIIAEGQLPDPETIKCWLKWSYDLGVEVVPYERRNRRCLVN